MNNLCFIFLHIYSKWNIIARIVLIIRLYYIRGDNKELSYKRCSYRFGKLIFFFFNN